MNVLKEEIEKAKIFFQQKDIRILENQCRIFNDEQPNFTATVLAMEMYGLTREKVEDLLESIFVIYYVHTVLRKKRIHEISIGQIRKNIQSFEKFVNYYNKEKQFEKDIDLTKTKFLKDDVVLEYAAEILKKLFKNAQNIPNEIILPYFALLKAIEIGAEKAG